MSNPSQTLHTNLGYCADISTSKAFEWLQSNEAVLVDVRTEAERAWVGVVDGSISIPWKVWPGMFSNPNFETQLKALVSPTKKVMFLCRSGVRSESAARAATALGYQSYNIQHGFEGEPDDHGHRGNVNGWKFNGQPWKQS